MRGVTVTTLDDSTMVRLDFGEYGHIDVPPEKAEALISDQTIRDQIRAQARIAHRLRQQNDRERQRQLVA